jgi:UDP-3-O-[3-hydroxymyristoyl] N-acetylglucosamine deacetylase/3-hydroxyacyl-[acyl-carrier-protein] dehydratase
MMQKTIAKPIDYKGVGLHSGTSITMRMLPAPEDTGIVFLRKDVGKRIPASLEFVKGCDREILLGDDGIFLRTPEHLLAAVFGMEIDNLYVEVDGDEVPFGDGSASVFVQLLKEAGIVEQKKERALHYIIAPVWIKEEGKSIVALPSSSLCITYLIHFEHPMVGYQFVHFSIDEPTFCAQIAPARTFGFLEEVQKLREEGKLRGGSLEHAVVLTKDSVMNPSLRFPDELVRHKVLDLLGDIALSPKRVVAHFIAIKSGHTLNIELAKKISSFIKSAQTLHKGGESMLQIEQIMNILPHRFPFLLVDKILHIEKGKRIVGVKNVSVNEHYFEGHFPQYPIMPGVLIVEAMAQVGGILILSEERNTGRLIYFTGMDNVRFRKPVRPGDQLLIEVVPIRVRESAGKMKATASVQNTLVAEAELMFALVEREKI